mmetsp:Transcript_38127/g.74895  ORF Transcript_38127/g.74895 Transcript_38127/m.74895 type:complete len:250 (-) Transcript_38127:77-826(-)
MEGQLLHIGRHLPAAPLEALNDREGAGEGRDMGVEPRTHQFVDVEEELHVLGECVHLPVREEVDALPFPFPPVSSHVDSGEEFFVEEFGVEGEGVRDTLEVSSDIPPFVFLCCTLSLGLLHDVLCNVNQAEERLCRVQFDAEVDAVLVLPAEQYGNGPGLMVLLGHHPVHESLHQAQPIPVLPLDQALLCQQAEREEGGVNYRRRLSEKSGGIQTSTRQSALVGLELDHIGAISIDRVPNSSKKDATAR